MSVKKKKKRVGVNGKAKGSAFERKIAGQMIDAANKAGYHLKKEDIYRTTMSGGHPFDKKHNPSDLVLSPKALKVYSILAECKFYKDLDLSNLLFSTSETHKEIKWLKQLLKEAKPFMSDSGKKWKRTPLLIFKSNKRATLCCFPASTFKTEIHNRAQFRYANIQWYVLPFDKFLKKVLDKKVVKSW